VVFSLWALVDNARLYLLTLLNGLTLASLYFIVASGFTLVFGLMRNVNLAHGSLYLLGGYVGYVVAARHRLVDRRAGRGLPRRGVAGC
jgi:branched-chain amino acid transport system permease protein